MSLSGLPFPIYPGFGIPSGQGLTYGLPDGSRGALPIVTYRVDRGGANGAGRGGALDRIRVLVADDTPVVRKALAALIANTPSLELVATAEDAIEAIELARLERPDVVLLDVKMPGGGGVRAAREIQEHCPQIRILALSAHADRSFVMEMLSAGAHGYILKGTQADRIVAAIEGRTDPDIPAAGHRQTPLNKDGELISG